MNVGRRREYEYIIRVSVVCVCVVCKWLSMLRMRMYQFFFIESVCIHYVYRVPILG